MSPVPPMREVPVQLYERAQLQLKPNRGSCLLYNFIRAVAPASHLRVAVRALR